MEITTVVNAHSSPNILLDTLDSILTYVGEKILVITDSNNKELNATPLPVPRIEGFYHNSHRAPYRNVALGLWKAYEMAPDSDWFCYTEYDCLFANSNFKKSLLLADKNDVWVLGNNSRKDDCQLPLIEAIIKEKIKVHYYVLGCCVFLCKEFMDRLNEINFFERLINTTQHFTEGFFPHYTGYDLSEHLYPTLAVQFGGDVASFANWDLATRTWTGNFRQFPIRWKPELRIEENFKEASILHPLKTYDHPIREYHRERRKYGKI